MYCNKNNTVVYFTEKSLKDMRNRMIPKMKSRYIAEALRKKIRSRKLGLGSPLPSARELAEQYNVCMMTANRALDILEKESIIIRVNGSGNFVQKNIVRGKRLLLGIADAVAHSDNYARNIWLDVFPEAAISYFKAENCDYRMVFYSDFLNQQEEMFADFDGILISTSYIDATTEKILRKLELPIVLYRGEYEIDLPFSQVIPDHSAAMNPLFSYAKEEKVPGILIYCNEHANGMARARAFEFYAKKHGFSENQIQLISFSELELRQYVLKNLPDIPGKLILTCSGFMTCELIQLCSEHGLVCGRDYQLVCYDNIGKSMKIPPGIPAITSIDYSRTTAAKTAARLLIQSVRNPNFSGYQTIKFPTKLQIHETAFQSRKELI